MERDLHLPSGRSTFSTSSSVRTSTSPIVKRGSAPKGTFQIPEEGILIPKEQSFLSRFRASRLRTATPASPARTAPASSGIKQDNLFRSANSPVHPNGHAIDDITASTAILTTTSSERVPIGTSIETIFDRQTSGAKTTDHVSDTNRKRSADDAHEYSPRVDDVTTKPSKPLITQTALQEDGKTLEQVADEVEDTLINVVTGTDSLLSDTRPSYPVLRFCAGKCLLDQKTVDRLGVPLGFIWCPFGEIQEANRVSRAPKRCGTCGSFVAKGNGGEEVILGSRVWTCGFCGRNDNDAGEAGFQANMAPQSYPEFSTDTVEYLHPQSGARPAAGRGAIILIVDENLDEEQAKWARAATAAVRTSASDRGLRLALITVGAGCSVAVQSSDEETATPTLEMMSVARASKLTPEEKSKFFLDAPGSKFRSISDSDAPEGELRSPDTDILICPREVPETLPNGSEGGERTAGSIETANEKENVHETDSRRLDIALFVAFELITGMADSENSRIVSLITGPPTLARHALQTNHLGQDGNLKPEAETEKDVNAALAKLYEQVGSRAGDMRIALDFLCFGAPSGFGGSILLGAAKRSRGGLVYTAAHSFSAASALAEAAVFLSERSTSPGVVSIRVSSPMMIARVIGPAFPTAAPHTYAVPGIDPLTGFTIILKSKADGENNFHPNSPSHAVVQLAAKSLGTTRVVTARIPITTDASKYLGSLDAEISALVVGKACLVSGGALTKPDIAAKSIDDSVQRLLRGSESLVSMARLLYELRRGLLIERHVNSDCALVLRSFFLWTECGTASLLMSPRLFTNAMSDASTGLMAEVPLEKKYITKDAVVVLDTGFNVFVYVGEEASKEAEDAISNSARSVGAQRLSPCQLWKMKPGRDADYVLDSYLSPREDVKDSKAQSFERGFLAYCAALVPESTKAQALKSS